jgi:hypothetical protein
LILLDYQPKLNQRVQGSSPCAPTNRFKGLAQGSLEQVANMRLFVRLLCLTAALAPASAAAQDPAAAKCAAYVAATITNGAERQTIEQWILGYVAGLRAANGARSLSAIEGAELLHKLAGYCGSRPLTRLDVAATMAASAAR